MSVEICWSVGSALDRRWEPRVWARVTFKTSKSKGLLVELIVMDECGLEMAKWRAKVFINLSSTEWLGKGYYGVACWGGGGGEGLLWGSMLGWRRWDDGRMGSNCSAMDPAKGIGSGCLTTLRRCDMKAGGTRYKRLPHRRVGWYGILVFMCRCPDGWNEHPGLGGIQVIVVKVQVLSFARDKKNNKD